MLDFSAFAGRRVKCAGLGEVLFDVYPHEAKIGGAPANFAYHCARLGLDALAISAVGRDELGFTARELLARSFLPALLFDSPRPTGTVRVELSDTGVPRYAFAEDTAYDHLPLTPALLETAGELDLICFGTLAQRGRESRRTILAALDAMRDGALRIFDVNLRGRYYSAEILEDSVRRADAVKCNEEELPVLCRAAGLGEASESAYRNYLGSRGVSCFILTRGADGSTVYLNDEVSRLPSPRVEVADTVGAGDAFTAALISLLARGRPLSAAHAGAVRLAAYVCTRTGAMPEPPAGLCD